jgi:putative peptide zinc metalloprotease protein
LLELSNHELDLEMEAALAQREETLAMELRALRMDAADLEPIRRRLDSIETKIKDLGAEKEALVVRARQAGIWVAPMVRDMVGTWAQRGSFLGEIVESGSFRFSAVVSQDEAADLFVGTIRNAEVRIRGQAGHNLGVEGYRIIPYRQERLPSAALGWMGGGEVPVSVRDETGLKAAEPFFQIYADLRSAPGVGFFHGRSGKLRFTLESRPLLFQWLHKFRQLIQKRYRI